MRNLVKYAGSTLVIAAFAIAPNANAQSNRMSTGTAPAAVETLTTLPAAAVTVNNWLKQNVYDPSGTKIGEIEDILVSDNGKLEAAIVAVGGFIGMGEKDVAVPFSAIQASERDGKWRLTMNTTKEALKSAPGFKYDRSRATWKTS